MKILMTADTVGGVWTYALELTRALPDIEFVLATMGELPPPAALPPNVKLHSSRFKLEWMDNPWADVENAGMWLLDIAQREQPDIVHLNGYAHAALHFDAPKLVVAHSDVMSWWRAVKGEDAPPEWMRYRKIVSRGLQSADLVVAPSRAMLDALRPHYSLDVPARVIYNGSTSSQVSGLRSQIVFSAGRMWDEAKNLRAVVSAAPRINAHVRIAGAGGVNAPNVTHLGVLNRDEMQRAFGEASVYLFPALYEPFGLSILEAALSGCALVIGDIPSLREIWGDAAEFVDPRDVDAIADATNRVLRDPRELAQRAQKRAALFTPERMANDYRRTYRQLNRGLGTGDRGRTTAEVRA